MAFIAAIILSYFIGSFPTSFILTKALTGVDIRQVGSGNAGATNVLRTVGKLPAIITLIIDILKGTFVVVVVAKVFHPYAASIDYDLFRVVLGLVVICGHIWSVFLKFRGGKGVATTLGVIGGLAPVSMLIPGLVVWLIVFIPSRYVSLASLVMGAAFPISALVAGESRYVVAFAITLFIINTYKHRSNIERLLKGAENRTTFSKKS